MEDENHTEVVNLTWVNYKFRYAKNLSLMSPKHITQCLSPTGISNKIQGKGGGISHM